MSKVPATHRPRPGTSLLLSEVDWTTYTSLCRIFDERPGIRLTFDRGVLEIMTPLPLHDGDARFLADLVVQFTLELKLPLRRGGSMTIRRRARQRGLEPDECFWIANASRMAGPRRYNPRTDPPPDLALEVDLTRSSLNRLGVYAAIGIPEVWRLDGDVLTFYALGTDQTYQEVPRSLSFPQIVPADLLRFIQMARQGGDETPVLEQFRQWARQLAGPTP